MNPSKIDIDRNISKLRVNSAEFLNLEKSNLITMLEQTIVNINTIAYYWASLSSEKKGNYDQLTVKFCLKNLTQKNYQKTRKPPKAQRRQSLLFLPPLLDVVAMRVRDGVIFI